MTSETHIANPEQAACGARHLRLGWAALLVFLSLGLSWLTKAADAGHALAATNLAALYYKGEGIEQDSLPGQAGDIGHVAAPAETVAEKTPVRQLRRGLRR